MSPVIRVDDEVYAWLQTLARPFDDTPNSVLRRVCGLDTTATSSVAEPAADLPAPKPMKSERLPQNQKEDHEMVQPLGERITGNALARRWKVSVRHALYHKDGTWYNNLTRFPGALFDPKGYVVFSTEADYRRCPQLSIGAETNVRPHVSSIGGYVRMEK